MRTLLGGVGLLAAAWAWPAHAAMSAVGEALDLTSSPVGIAGLLIFAVAYAFVMAEEFTHLRKSKPVILAAGVLWALVAMSYASLDKAHVAEQALRHNLLEYGELFLFLLVAMTYINAMEERQIFECLKAWLVRRRFGFRHLFWITGGISFFLSPVADNLTTALLMCAVVLAVGAESPRFVGVACVNIVVAANAGGAFSPFGDITTLMVWQKGLLDFSTFFVLFVPAAVSFLVPAAIMQFAVPNSKPSDSGESVLVLRGGFVIVGLFLLTIATAVSFHNFLHLPPVVGMMTGLAYLQFFAYYLKRTHRSGDPRDGSAEHDPENLDQVVGFDVFNKISRAEWDTLLFFYGVILCVGALGQMGYLAMASDLMYNQMGPTVANSLVGFLSAIVDNIPVMFAVLTMQPEMSQGQWLLVTLTAGIGGSMLSIGSAAGVALMGQARGKYTFFSHLKWAPAIALGYGLGVATHFWWNAERFAIPIG